MADIEVEAAVLGCGKTLAAALGRARKRVAVVERSSQMYGGSYIKYQLRTTKALTVRSRFRVGCHVVARLVPRGWIDVV